MIRIARTTYTDVSATYHHLYFMPFIITLIYYKSIKSTIISSTGLLLELPQLDYDTLYQSLAQIGHFDGDGACVGSIEAADDSC